MNCRKCRNPFSSEQGHFPRVLISCGHTICQTCIQSKLHQGKIICQQCNQQSFGTNITQYPINANLLSILNSQSLCRLHNQKLQAYCEKDNELLCLGCVIGGTHKSHKISSITQKVQKDKSILEESGKQICNSKSENEETLRLVNEYSDKIEQDYKDILLQIGLFFNNLRENLKDIEQSYLGKAKNDYDAGREKLGKSREELEEKNKFMEELIQMSHQLIQLPDIQYLNEDNKRIFIVENCKQKKPKIQSQKLIFNKIQAYNDTINIFQELLSFEKKIQSQNTPTMKNKKKSQKQPTVLEVNLHQQYSKHYKYQNKPRSKPHQKNNSVNLRTPKQHESKSKKQQIMLSISQQEKHNQSQHEYQSLQMSMVDSFMKSSIHSFSIKGSEAQFTMHSYCQKVYHFGSYNHSSIQTLKLDENTSATMLGQVHRSKFQTAYLSNYSLTKCLLFGGKSIQDEKLDTFLQYDFVSDHITQCSFHLSEPKSGFGSTIKDGKIYIAGGSNSKKSLKAFQEYRLIGLGFTHRQMPSMNFSRDQLGLTLGFDGNIYACGGINESGVVLASCERFNWQKSKWENIPSMKTPRRCFTLVSLPHGLMAIGGFNGKDYLASVEIFDFERQKWVEIASLSLARFSHSAVVTNDFQSVIVSGGFNMKPLKSVQILDVMEGKWKKGQNLVHQRFLHSSLIVNF